MLSQRRRQLVSRARKPLDQRGKTPISKPPSKSRSPRPLLRRPARSHWISKTLSRSGSTRLNSSSHSVQEVSGVARVSLAQSVANRRSQLASRQQLPNQSEYVAVATLPAERSVLAGLLVMKSVLVHQVLAVLSLVFRVRVRFYLASSPARPTFFTRIKLPKGGLKTFATLTNRIRWLPGFLRKKTSLSK